MRSWSSPVFYKKAHDYLLSIITIHVDMKIIWKNFEIAKEQQGILNFLLQQHWRYWFIKKEIKKKN